MFIYKQDNIFTDYEYVYEVHHLEQMLPSPVGAAADLSSLDEKGILTLNCTDTREVMRFYNDKKYWNLDLREDFLAQTRNFWRDGSSSKDFSRVLDIGREPDNKEDALMKLKVDKELDEAVKKLGRISTPQSYPDKWQSDIWSKRERIAEAALSK